MFGLFFWFFIAIVFYTYAGYPLLLALLARAKPRRAAVGQSEDELPSVTLLVAAYNEQAVISDKIENSLALDYPRARLQILVVSDGSEDRTAEIVRGYAAQGVELAYDPVRRGKSAAISQGVSFARGEILVFSDANNMYAPTALRELAAPFADPTVGGVSGAKRIERGTSALGESEGLYWKYESLIKKLETRLGSCTGVAGEILAVRRGLFQAPPPNVINDDFYIALSLIRRGYRVVYAPRALSFERVSPTAQDEVARRARIVAGRYQALALAPSLLTLRRPLVAWQVLSHKFLRPLVPFAMLGALLANLGALAVPGPAALGPLGLSFPFNWAAMVAQLVFYALAVTGRRVARSSKLSKALYLPTFLVNSNWAAVIGLYRFATKQQTTLWQRVPRASASSFKDDRTLRGGTRVR